MITVYQLCPAAPLKTPLVFNISMDGEFFQIEDKNLHILIFGETKEELESNLRHELEGLWLEYALEEDSRLSPPAIELKNKLLELVIPQQQ